MVIGDSRAYNDMDTFTIHNPATGEPLAEVASAGPDEVSRSVDQARLVFETEWRESTPADRAALLSALADAVDRHAGELYDLDRLEAGKTIKQWTDGDRPFGVDVLRFCAGAARTLSGPAAGAYSRGFMSHFTREPVGVVAAILPWNYPFMMAAWKVGSVLAAGNALILKPSPWTPGSAIRLAELAREVGFPCGVVNVVTGAGHTGSLLAEHPDVDMVTLTGSRRAATSIMQAAAPTVKRTHFELGGKAPIIVFDDADQNALYEGLKRGCFPNAGESCTQTGRILVHRSRFRDLQNMILDVTRDLAVGDPSDYKTDVGPLITDDHLRNVHGLVHEAVGNGASVLAGGAPVDRDGYFYPPTVLIGAHPTSTINMQEVFGPVVTIIPFEDEREATNLANLPTYGLAASVWTKDHQRALRMSRDLRAGCVWINTAERLVAEMPHGGFKQSGYGKDLSTESIQEFTVAKHVMSAL